VGGGGELDCNHMAILWLSFVAGNIIVNSFNFFALNAMQYSLVLLKNIACYNFVTQLLIQ
jgi:hypothetical protein